MGLTSHLIFVQTALGLEEACAAEVRRLLPHLGPPGLSEGGVLVRLSTSDLWTLCLLSRLAEGVRVRLKAFAARDFATLETGLARLQFPAFLRRGQEVEVRAVSHRSRLWHSGAVEERTRSLLQTRFGVLPGSAKEGASLVFLRLTGDTVQVSVDASGPFLHRRGYRTHVAEASVRETLAAAVALHILVPEGTATVPEVIWDPFCGAGTLGLEALSLARGLLAGTERHFAFEDWPTHDGALFAAHREHLAAQAPERALAPKLSVILSDRDARALDAARANAEQAGLADGCTFQSGDVRELAAGIPRCALISNPPYGKRLAQGGAIDALIQVLERRPDLRPCALLIGGPARQKLPPSFSAVLHTKSGGTNVSIRVLRGALGRN